MVQLLKLLEVLSHAEVEFVLVGGAAAFAHGSTMVTQDLDICGSMTSENTERIAKALAAYAPKHRISKEKPAFTPEQASNQHFNNIYLSTDLGQLDILGQVKGIGDYEAALAASQDLPIGDFTIKILSLSKLIEAKTAMGRPHDLQNVAILRGLQDERN
jgi:hypothetical protein